MSKKPENSRTVARVVEVLELIAGRRNGVGISAIASELDLPVSSAHVLIRRLLELEYLKLIPNTKLYMAGPRLNRLGIKLTSVIDVIDIGRPFIRALAERTGEDIYLAVAEDNGITYADRVEGSNSVRLQIALGEPRLLHATAMGKLYLAFQSEPHLKQLLGTLEFIKCGSLTITTEQALLQDLAEIRQRGYALSINEHIEGIAAVSAPVFDRESELVAAVGIAVPISRFNTNKPYLIQETITTAIEISKQLGFDDADKTAGNPEEKAALVKEA